MRFQHKILPQLEKKKCDNNEVLRLESHNHKESLFPRFFSNSVSPLCHIF